MNNMNEKLNEIIKLSQTDLLAADALITEIVENKPATSHELMILAFIKSLQGQYEKAVEALLENNKLYPGSAISYFNLGYCYRQINQMNKACNALEKAADFSNWQDIPTMTLLGSTYHQLGDLDFAKTVFNKILAINPESIFGLFYLLQVSKEVKDFKQAIALQHRLQEVLEKDQDSAAKMTAFISRYDYFEWREANDKGSLTKLVNAYQKAHKNFNTSFYPESYVMPEDYSEISKKYKKSKIPWIIKPRFLMGGQGIHLSDDVSRIPNEEGWVVQKYIDNPLLIEGRKFNLRLYLLFESINPLRIFIWKNGVIFIASDKYPKNLSDLSMTAAHVANPFHGAGQRKSSNLVEEEKNFLTLELLFHYLGKKSIDSSKVWNNIKTLARWISAVFDEEDFFFKSI